MIRTFDPRDDEAIVAFFTRLHAHDPSIDATDLERWRGYRAMKLFEDGRRFLVAEDGGRIVALSTLGEMHGVERVRIFVDPSHRRRGIARTILERREADARASNVIATECFIDGRWTAALALAKKHDYAVFVHDLFLRRDATPWTAKLPDGVRLRPYAGRADDAAWVAISNAALARDAGYHAVSESDMAGFAKMPGFELFFAESLSLSGGEASGAPMGYCHLETRGDIGYLQALAVLASHESRGIGAALLSRAIESLRRTSAFIELCTEKDNVRAQRLYARAGFTLDREAFTVRKTIPRL
jgi:mycothiol synthase